MLFSYFLGTIVQSNQTLFEIGTAKEKKMEKQLPLQTGLGKQFLKKVKKTFYHHLVKVDVPAVPTLSFYRGEPAMVLKQRAHVGSETLRPAGGPRSVLCPRTPLESQSTVVLPWLHRSTAPKLADAQLMLVPLELGQFWESFPNTCSHWHVRITGWACPHVEMGILSWSTIWSMVTSGGRLFSSCSGRQSPGVNCPHNGPKNVQPDFLIRCTVKHSAMSINAS